MPPTSQSLSPEDIKRLNQEMPALGRAANQFLGLITPALENKKGHIETDIAGASAVAGSMILRDTVMDIDTYPVGTAILSEVHERQQMLFTFMKVMAKQMGLDPEGWNFNYPDQHHPHFELVELIRRLQGHFIEVASKSGVTEKFRPLIAAMTAVKLVAAGHAMKLLDQSIGKNLVTHFVISGSKTVPPRLVK